MSERLKIFRFFSELKTRKILNKLFFPEEILAEAFFIIDFLYRASNPLQPRQLINCRLFINQRDYKITKSDIVEENRKIKGIERLTKR